MGDKRKTWAELTRRQRREVRKWVRQFWHNSLGIPCEPAWHAQQAALRELREPRKAGR